MSTDATPTRWATDRGVAGRLHDYAGRQRLVLVDGPAYSGAVTLPVDDDQALAACLRDLATAASADVAVEVDE